MKIKKTYWNLIVKFYTDHLSNDELEKLEKWKIEKEENLKFFKQFKKVLKGADNTLSKFNTDDDQLWERLQTRINIDIESEKNKVNDLKKRFIRLSIAVSIAIFFSIGVFFLFNKNSEEQTFITVKTLSNSQKIQLKDSSWVYLSENSTLIYSVYFNENRYTELEGEAYFIVTKDTAYPFVVLTKTTRTKVVGTEFNMKTENENVEIKVIKGVVEFGDVNRKKNINIKKGETAYFDSKKKKINKSKTKKKKINKSKTKKKNPEWFKKLKKEVTKAIKKIAK